MTGKKDRTEQSEVPERLEIPGTEGMIVRVSGIVQGVGFRPFIHRLAAEHGLRGVVRNTFDGVWMKLEGSGAGLEDFLRGLEQDCPVQARIDRIRTERYAPPEGFDSFTIAGSDRSGEVRNTLIPPDICTCAECRRELFDRENRRYHFPFINCTNCGPRFTIIRDVPYDRARTSMAPFWMCAECAAEYEDIRDRRYHAQPDCCGVCGPVLEFVSGAGAQTEARRTTGEAAVKSALAMLDAGGIVAVKGLGGFHLCCRTDMPEVIRELRRRKHRDDRPFAIMCADPEESRRFAVINEAEERLLLSPQRPIVLLRKRKPDPLVQAVSEDADIFRSLPEISENHRIGIMLPYTPLHELMLSGAYGTGIRSLIMTSANLSERPVISGNEEALRELDGIAGGFLLHDREIVNKCDDSVVWEFEGRAYFARRSRGYVPAPVYLGGHGKKPQVLACGAEQKASFALNLGDQVFLSQHIGDLKNIETLIHYDTQIRRFEKLFDIKPELFACDLHPDYMSTAYADEAGRKARERDPGGRGQETGGPGEIPGGPDGMVHRGPGPVTGIQHHHAHMASCMADNGLEGRCLGIIWDGTGLGTDGTVWGGEFLLGDPAGSERVGSLRPVRLPGGDKCVTEIWRTAVSMMYDAGLEEADIAAAAGRPEAGAVRTVLAQLRAGLNCPASSGMGRLFDGAAAILGIRTEAGYEGQGAVLLEAAAAEYADGYVCRPFPYEIYRDDKDVLRIDHRQMTAEMAAEMLKADSIAGRAVSENTGDMTPTAAETARGRDGGPEQKMLQGRLSLRFMYTLCAAASEMAARLRAEHPDFSAVVLSGGSFQNMYLLKTLKEMLEADGFRVYIHRQVSPNDEGIALGQLAAVLARRGSY